MVVLVIFFVWLWYDSTENNIFVHVNENQFFLVHKKTSKNKNISPNVIFFDVILFYATNLGDHSIFIWSVMWLFRHRFILIKSIKLLRLYRQAALKVIKILSYQYCIRCSFKSLHWIFHYIEKKLSILAHCPVQIKLTLKYSKIEEPYRFVISSGDLLNNSWKFDWKKKCENRPSSYFDNFTIHTSRSIEAWRYEKFRPKNRFL